MRMGVSECVWTFPAGIRYGPSGGEILVITRMMMDLQMDLDMGDM